MDQQQPKLLLATTAQRSPCKTHTHGACPQGPGHQRAPAAHGTRHAGAHRGVRTCQVSGCCAALSLCEFVKQRLGPGALQWATCSLPRTWHGCGACSIVMLLACWLCSLRLPPPPTLRVRACHPLPSTPYPHPLHAPARSPVTLGPGAWAHEKLGGLADFVVLTDGTLSRSYETMHPV